MYWYISHMGGIFPSDYELDLNDLYCEQCGDYDEFLGEFETEEEAEFAYYRWMNGDEEEEEND